MAWFSTAVDNRENQLQIGAFEVEWSITKVADKDAGVQEASDSQNVPDSIRVDGLEARNVPAGTYEICIRCQNVEYGLAAIVSWW